MTALSITLLGCGSGVTDPGGGITGEPIATFQGTRTAGCPAPRPRTVLVDPTHDGGGWWFPQYFPDPSGYDWAAPHQGQSLADYFRARGYTVTELGRRATMSPDSLLTYAVVVRAGYYYDAEHPGYSDGYLAAYDALVECGRTLIVLADFLRDRRKDDLAEALGIPFVGMITSTITSFTPHALTTGVTSIPFIAGSYLANENNPAIQVLGRLGSGEAVMGLLTRGSAKIFFLGDINGIEQVPQPLVSNLMMWGF